MFCPVTIKVKTIKRKTLHHLAVFLEYKLHELIPLTFNTCLWNKCQSGGRCIHFFCIVIKIKMIWTARRWETISILQQDQKRAWLLCDLYNVNIFASSFSNASLLLLFFFNHRVNKVREGQMGFQDRKVNRWVSLQDMSWVIREYRLKRPLCTVCRFIEWFCCFIKGPPGNPGYPGNMGPPGLPVSGIDILCNGPDAEASYFNVLWQVI